MSLSQGPLLLALLLSPQTDSGESAAPSLWLPRILSDHAVLQCDAPVPVWGRSAPGASVTVRASWSPGELAATSGPDGRFRVDLPAGEAGGPHELVVSDGTTELVLEDLLLGEVWLASGQSNMQWPLSATNDAELAIRTADLPELRFFEVRRRIALRPEEDCEGEWRLASPDTVPGFSAVAHHFGRTLHEELGVPVGLVGSYWGGTRVEAWTSGPSLATRDDMEPMLARLAEAVATPEAMPTVRSLQAAWWSGWKRLDPGMQGGWSAPDLPLEAWRPAEVPGDWEALGLGGHDGTVWYRCTFEAPEDWLGRELVLDLGSIDDMDVTWFNGDVVGETLGDGRHLTPRAYTVPGILVGPTNTVVVCAVDSGGVGRFGDPGHDVTIAPGDGETADGLVLRSWTHRAGASLGELGAWPRTTWFDQNYPSALYNAMIAPLVPYGLRGAIWYQGEANVGDPLAYRTLFPLLIEDWRGLFEQPELPFYFVQLAPFGYSGDTGNAAELREAQTMALDLPATGMAVTMDIGNPGDIHPREKALVGQRLARWALAGPYGRAELEVSGPLLAGWEVEGGAIRLSFDHAESGLVAEGGPTCFTIAGEDGVFRPAQARIEDRTVLVWSDEVPAPVAVRHAWGAADGPNLANGEGLPAPSFRTR